MAKKDFSINENTDRSPEPTSPPKEEQKKVQYTEVKNANASGMGTMGRNTEEPTSTEVKKVEQKPQSEGESF